MQKFLSRLFNPVDPDLVAAYRSAIPDRINLDITENGDSYLAVITKIADEPLPKEVFLVTEAKTESELISMVNDLIFTYKKIPENYRPFYQQILKPNDRVASSKSLSLVKS